MGPCFSHGARPSISAATPSSVVTLVKYLKQLSIKSRLVGAAVLDLIAELRRDPEAAWSRLVAEDPAGIGERLRGAETWDTIFGRGGNDTLAGEGGDDVLELDSRQLSGLRRNI